jgi:hypothetical protein
MCNVYNSTLVCSEITIKADNDTEIRTGFSRSLFVVCPLDEFYEGVMKQIIRVSVSFHFTICSHPSI